MSEEKVIEVEAVEASQPERPVLNTVVDETVKLLESLGKALVTTAQDLSSLMVIKVDQDTRERLDMLVDAGVAQSRREAATSLINKGIAASSPLFEKIERTQAQVAALKAQMRSIIGGQS